MPAPESRNPSDDKVVLHATANALDAAIRAVEDAGGDNCEYHVQAIRALAQSTGGETWSQSQCGWCGAYHPGVCPRVKTFEYYPDGTVKCVEFWVAQDELIRDLKKALRDMLGLYGALPVHLKPPAVTDQEKQAKDLLAKLG